MKPKLTMGEKLKDLRTERGLTTKEACRMTGVSENIYNGLENDIGRDTGFSRIVALAKFFEVPTDYLLGFTESRITRNVALNELGLSDIAIKVLLSKEQSPQLVSKLIEHPDFTHLINAIDVYVRQLAAPNISTVNNLTRIAEHGIKNYYADGKPKPEGYDEAIRYMNETVVQEDEFLRYQITERFNQILRDMYAELSADVSNSISLRTNGINEMSGHIHSALDKIKSGEMKIDTLEDALEIMMGEMGMDDDLMKLLENDQM